MAFPQFPKKHEQEVLITPKQHWLAEADDYKNFQAPKSVILCFESYVIDHFKDLPEMEFQRFWTGEMLFFTDTKNEVAVVGNFGIGGPAASQMLEILIAAGTEKFIVVGHAGGLQQSIAIGSVILCDAAVRDDGVSHHYLKPSKYAYPSSTLSNRIKAELDSSETDFKMGGSWTIDSMYRETKDEVLHYAREGIVTVEMELASLFAVAAFRKVEIASLLVISDHVSFEDWEEQFHSDLTNQAILKCMKIAKNTILR